MEITFPVSDIDGQTATTTDVRACVHEASSIIAPYWPIDGFIANNTLAHLEHMPFHQAVQKARDLRGGHGFLPLATYRSLFEQGRITEQALDTAIASLQETLALPQHIHFHGQAMPAQPVYRAWLLQHEDADVVRREKPAAWQQVTTLLQASDLPLHEVHDGDDGSLLTQTKGEQCFVRDGQAVVTVVNKRMIRWCAAFLDEGQAAWSMPGREQGFYSCWKALAGEDHSFRFYAGRQIQEQIHSLPADAHQVLELCLRRLKIPEALWSAYLSRHLAQLSGWASLIRWREEHPSYPWQQRCPITLVDYLAVRLFYEAVLVEVSTADKQAQAPVWSRVFQPRLSSRQEERLQPHSEAGIVSRIVLLADVLKLQPQELAELAPEHFKQMVVLARNWSTEKQQMLWQEAYECQYRTQLIQTLRSHQDVADRSPMQTTCAAQALFCIDVRSEGLRRHLEMRGPYETYGVAGFFAVPMMYQPFGSSYSMALAPALIAPPYRIREVASDTASARALAQRRLNANMFVHSWRELLHALREHLLTPFAFVEMVGGWSVFPLLGKTLFPQTWKKMQGRLQKALLPAVPTEPSILTDCTATGMSREEQAALAGNMLRCIGLTGSFARIVLLCGHASETDNNPYAAALDCGACGGHAGGTNATVTASILNSPSIRTLLAEQGIMVPEETFFLAAEHNTTTDTITFFNAEQLPASHQAAFEQLKQDLAAAGQTNSVERASRLPDAPASASALVRHLKKRATDWAQVRPEWGLARNAVFLCGRRALSAGVNLDGRVFLQSYDHSQDPEGTILEGILTAPLIVAEWINMQYYFSTIDNDTFGSSTKLLHTVVGQTGVMQGKQSDLLIGLPRQSVMFGDHLHHEPLRLLAIVEANPETISAIIAQHEQLQHLVDNRWISLVAYDPTSAIWYQYMPATGWRTLL